MERARCSVACDVRERLRNETDVRPSSSSHDRVAVRAHRDARVVECAELERRQPVKLTIVSSPTPAIGFPGNVTYGTPARGVIELTVGASAGVSVPLHVNPLPLGTPGAETFWIVNWPLFGPWTVRLAWAGTGDRFCASTTQSALVADRDRRRCAGVDQRVHDPGPSGRQPEAPRRCTAAGSDRA